ncbi:MAG: PadR family transcriptional regulator [Bacteroidetes bacterium]|nr:PadR family transcriptional regulator [Bacteroidota bacterium]
MKLLTRQEEIVLLSIWKLKGNAYGVSIREYISQVTGKYWSIGSIYVPLDKLVEREYVKTYQGKPTEKRGGKSKRFYEITEEGINALADIKEVQNMFWEGFNKPALD